MTSLQHHLRIFNRYMRLRDGWNLAQRSLWIACLLALSIQITGHFLPIQGLLWWSVALISCWILFVAGYSAFRPLSMMQIARRVDTELNLFERLSTSLALNELSRAFPVSLIHAQQEDAIRTAQAIDPRQAFPLRWKKQPVIFFALLLVILVVVANIPNPMDAILAERAAVRKEAQTQAERIEALIEQVAQAEGLSDDERQELQNRLAELAEKLRTNPGDLEEALAEISQLEEMLKAKLDTNAASKAANLESLADQLASLAGNEREASQSAGQSAAESLNQLAEQMTDMDSDQRQGLAEALAQMAAQTAQAGNSELAQALSQMAQAMQAANQAEANNNQQAMAEAQAAAQTAAQNAAQAASASQQQLSAQQTLQQALSQLQASRQALSQASSQALAQAGRSGQTGSSGQSGSTAQNANSGAAAGQSAAGQGTTSGGGTDASTLPPSTGQGQPNLNPQGSQPAAAESDLSSQIYSPRQQGSSNGDELFIPGQDTGQGETTSSQGQSSQPGSFNPALVPYYRVFYQYLLAANQSIQQGYIPLSLLQYIQAYFLQLEQGR